MYHSVNAQPWCNNNIATDRYCLEEYWAMEIIHVDTTDFATSV